MKTSWFKTIAGVAVAALTIGFAPKAQAASYGITLMQPGPEGCGTVSVNKGNPVAEGTLVTVTATPGTGYSLVKVGVATTAGQAVAVTQTATGGTFTMPADNVNVGALFVSSSLEMEHTSYRYAVYKTDGVPSSGIKEWKEGEKDCIPVVGSTDQVDWGALGTETWYVVNDDVTISKRITCYGDVHLVLKNGYKLTSSSTTSTAAGIGVSACFATLNIYGQPASWFSTPGELECGAGTVSISSGYGCAAIGGSGYSTSETSGKVSSGAITIHGGKVTANSGTPASEPNANGAGIGGGASNTVPGTGSNITINGGEVTVWANSYGAGIGGGSGTGGGNGSDITINGGSVTVTAYSSNGNASKGGANIGGGNYPAQAVGGGGNGSNITINDGTVVLSRGIIVTGPSYGNCACIGGGRPNGSGSNIAINGGTVTAMAGGGSATIGGAGTYTGSQAGAGSNITIGQNATVYLCNYVFSGALRNPVIGGASKSGGYGEASGNSIAPGAKVFFNLASTSMPGSCEGLTIMTPATLNQGGYLVQGIEGWTEMPTFNLVNSTLTATDKLTVNDTVGSVFEGKLLKLPIMSSGLALTMEDPPTVYDITIDPDITGGTVTNVPAGSAQEGRVVELTATPDEGKELDKYDVYKTGEKATKVTVTDGTFTMPAYAVTVSATFKAAKYAVTIDPAIQHGTVTASPESPVEAGAEVTLTATPATGYALGAYDVYKTGVPTTKVPVTDSKFTMPAYPVTVSATFVELPPVYTNPEQYKIVNTTYQIYVNGKLAPEVVPGLGVWQIASNATATVVYTCADGYQFADGSTSKTVTLGTDHNPVVPSEITPAAPVLKTEPTLTLGAVMQRYPWNNVLDIPYEMTNLMTSQKYGLTVTLINGTVTKTVDTGITAEGVTSKSGVYSLDIGEQAPDFMNLPRTAIQVEGEVFVK